MAILAHNRCCSHRVGGLKPSLTIQPRGLSYSRRLVLRPPPQVLGAGPNEGANVEMLRCTSHRLKLRFRDSVRSLRLSRPRRPLRVRLRLRLRLLSATEPSLFATAGSQCNRCFVVTAVWMLSSLQI
jgi:hypothetical protein